MQVNYVIISFLDSYYFLYIKIMIRQQNINKPELLLPVGKIEAFYAAIEGGADAVYLGLKQFNARGRASNFSLNQLQTLLGIAHKSNVKVYITLNTLIKNEELSELIQYISALHQLKVDAIILQDWGVFYLVRQNFPDLICHASTQMANHNSAGANFSKASGFERIIFARELTMHEVQSVRKKSDVGMEIFVHGALCYSFSGMCLFSSYLGGASANRGLCAQPCRRMYQQNSNQKLLFSLKDNQLIDYIPQMMKIGIDSIKVEGRMKSAEYVYTVARAYRLAIDHPDQIDEAKTLLNFDFGREKTDYFWGHNVHHAITEHPTSGFYLGKVQKVYDDSLIISSSMPMEKGFRLRIDAPDDTARIVFKLNQHEMVGEHYKIFCESSDIQKGDRVFLAGTSKHKFSSKLPERSGRPLQKMSPGKIKSILSNLSSSQKSKSKEQLYVRIDNLAWLRKIHLNTIDGLFLKFTQDDFHALDLNAPFLQKFKNKIWIELPRFISESHLDDYHKLCSRFARMGFNQFMLGHLSQKMLLPEKIRFATNENVYCMNDAAIQFIKEAGALSWIYPLENDLDNMKSGKDRSGIVSLYYYPEVFYSRMPVTAVKNEEVIRDDKGLAFKKMVREGMTILVSERPVSWVHYKSNLLNSGFHKFLIDLSHTKSSKNFYQTLLKRYQSSSQIQPSTVFNYKYGLK